MKTRSAWFHSIKEEGVRKQLFKNTPREKLNKNVGSLSKAITGAFCWSEAPEGANYWVKIAHYEDSPF